MNIFQKLEGLHKEIRKIKLRFFFIQQAQLIRLMPALIHAVFLLSLQRYYEVMFGGFFIRFC